MTRRRFANRRIGSASGDAPAGGDETADKNGYYHNLCAASCHFLDFSPLPTAQRSTSLAVPSARRVGARRIGVRSTSGRSQVFLSCWAWPMLCVPERFAAELAPRQSPRYRLLFAAAGRASVIWYIL